MTCPKDRELEDYVRGRLDNAKEEDIRKHVEECQACQSRMLSVKTDESMLLKAMSALMDGGTGRCTTIASLKKEAKNEHFISSVHGSRVRLDIAQDEVLGDRYKIVRALGPSGKPVYQAHDLELRRDVALKIVVVDPTRAESAVKQLRQELQLRTLISDFTNIIRASDIHPLEFEGLSLVVLTMEYADGGSLRSWLSQDDNDGDRRIEEGIGFIVQACRGCSAAHDRGVAHLDIKPENILLCKVDDRLIAKLSDFGISRGLTQVATPASDVLLLAAGTPIYMSPEQFDPQHKKVGIASDIYSLGVVLFEILTGSPPFIGTYSQLRDQHSNVTLPTLKGNVSNWDSVVKKCMAKQPEQRYSDVGQLVADLVRGQKGYSLSIDVACPDCGNINIDQMRLTCRRCKRNLPETYFRPCPKCLANVRLDQDDCPRCGRNGVAAYYLLEERKVAIERLKDEAPIEAIELIEITLRQGAGDFDARATELIKELRTKQKKILPLASNAQKARSAGRIEEAIGVWQKVLEIIPRHKLALKSIDELRAIVQRFSDNNQRVPRLMDEGRFEEADGLLRECLELMPLHEEVRQALAGCRQRAARFNEAFGDAKASEKAKVLHKAEKQLVRASSHASECSAVTELQKQISTTIKKNKEFARQCVALLPQARFEELERIVSSIEETQLDCNDLLELKKKSAAASSSYTEAIAAAHEARERRDLAAASESGKSALATCPESKDAISLVEQVDSDQQKVNDLIEQAKRILPAARFTEAAKLLSEAGMIWTTAKEFKEGQQVLSRMRTEYEKYMDEARAAVKNGDLAAAFEAAQSAVSICEESTDAISLCERIRTRQGKANSLLEQAKSNARIAEFDRALVALGDVKKHWPNMPGIGEIEEQLTEKKSEYWRSIAAAQDAKNKKDLQVALKAAESAWTIADECPRASSLYEEIEALQQKARSHIEMVPEKLKAADFDGATAEFNRAFSLWPTLGSIDWMRERIQNTNRHYSAEMLAARDAFDKKNLDVASAAIERALEACPESKETRELYSDIGYERDKREDKREDRRKLARAMLALGALLIVLGLLGLLWDVLSPIGLGGRICLVLLALQYVIYVYAESETSEAITIFFATFGITCGAVLVIALIAHFLFHAHWSTGIAIGLWLGVLVCLVGLILAADA